VQKWGNSLALRIPRAFAADVGIGQDSAVDVSVVDGKILVAPVTESVHRMHYTLEELMAGVTDENIHPETDTGPSVGKEVW
jgi:antitoxin MazE